MKFTVSSAEFLKALNVVGGAVPSKSTLPILSCILFEKADDVVRLSATDLEISIIQHLPVQFETNGAQGRGERVAVPAKRLLDTLRALPDIPVHFSADEDFNLLLTTDQGRYKMVGFDGADYPALPDLSENRRIQLDAGVLKRAINKTSFAVSKDALRPAMMGIYFQIGPEEGRAVATDGHRLVRLKLDGMTSGQQTNFIVPEKALALAGRVAEGECSIAVDNGYVGFDFGRSIVLARIIDETYPNYEAVIPIDNERRLTVNRDAMLSAVRRVGLYSSTMTNQIRISAQHNKVEISAEDIERSSEAKETVLCDYDSDPLVIGFNAAYLTEVLSNVDSEDVVLEFSSPNRAGVVTPAEQEPGEEMLMLIMPVMLNTYA